jgi:valyl-tRNA synthetase
MKALDKYCFSEAFDTLYHTAWDDFADWQDRSEQRQVNGAAYGPRPSSLAHPFAPFVTETIWQTLAWEPDTILAKSPKNPVAAYDKTMASEFEEIRTIVSEARTIIANCAQHAHCTDVV